MKTFYTVAASMVAGFGLGVVTISDLACAGQTTGLCRE